MLTNGGALPIWIAFDGEMPRCLESFRLALLLRGPHLFGVAALGMQDSISRKDAERLRLRGAHLILANVRLAVRLQG